MANTQWSQPFFWQLTDEEKLYGHTYSMHQLWLPPFHAPGTPCQQLFPHYYFSIICCSNIQKIKIYWTPTFGGGHKKNELMVLVFKLSPCCSNDKLSSGYFPSVWVLKADVLEHCISSSFNRWWSVSEDCLVFSPYLYGKRISWKVEDGLKLCKTWKPLIHLLKRKKQQFNASSGL